MTKDGIRDKKYKDADDNTKTTKVYSSLQNLICELFKGSGLYSDSTHSGRQTLATWLDDNNVPLETIQIILDHQDPEMTLE